MLESWFWKSQAVLHQISKILTMVLHKIKSQMLRENKHFQHLAFYNIRKNKPFFSVPTGYV